MTEELFNDIFSRWPESPYLNRLKMAIELYIKEAKSGNAKGMWGAWAAILTYDPSPWLKRRDRLRIYQTGMKMYKESDR